MMTDERKSSTKTPHSLILENRKLLTATGVSNVDSFDEDTIIAYTDLGAYDVPFLETCIVVLVAAFPLLIEDLPAIHPRRKAPDFTGVLLITVFISCAASFCVHRTHRSSTLAATFSRFFCNFNKASKSTLPHLLILYAHLSNRESSIS